MAVTPSPLVASAASRLAPVFELRRIVRQPLDRRAPHLTRDAETPAAACEVADDDRPRVEQLFLDWLADPEKPDVIMSVSGSTSTPSTAFLGPLSTSSRPLPPSAATIVGLPIGATIGEAAVQLIMAVHDPAGPRCPSYRAAVAFVHDLHKYAFDMAELS